MRGIEILNCLAMQNRMSHPHPGDGPADSHLWRRSISQPTLTPGGRCAGLVTSSIRVLGVWVAVVVASVPRQRLPPVVLKPILTAFLFASDLLVP